MVRAMTVDYELRGHVAVMTINRPSARNAVNTDVAPHHCAQHEFGLAVAKLFS